MIESFKHKGLEEIHRTGKTRRIGADYVRRCMRIMQLLEDGRVVWQPRDSRAELIALPESLTRDGTPR